VRKRVGASIGVIAAFSALLAAASCDEASALSLLGGTCNLNSDCEGALVCLSGTCHEQCHTSEDCGESGACVVTADRVRVCQTDAEASCRFHSECPPGLVCAIDGNCRNQCAADRDCVPGQRCAGGACADPEDLVDGRLVPADVDPVGTPCVYSSDCPAGEGGLRLLCKSGQCSYGCYEERDCGRFHRCTAPAVGEPGDCELIGPPGALYCDPDEDPAGGRPCDCVDGGNGTQTCKSDGSGLDPCICN
jgi:hypothetical protein